MARTHTEFEVFFRDGIPELVHHHDGEQRAQCTEESTINVVLYILTNLVVEAELKHKSSHE